MTPLRGRAEAGPDSELVHGSSVRTPADPLHAGIEVAASVDACERGSSTDAGSDGSLERYFFPNV